MEDLEDAKWVEQGDLTLNLELATQRSMKIGTVSLGQVYKQAQDQSWKSHHWQEAHALEGLKKKKLKL